MTDSSSPDPGSNVVSRLLTGLLHRLQKRHGDGTLRQSLEDVIEEHAFDTGQDDLSAAERTMLRNLLSYGELRVDDVAVPRADIIAFDAAGSFDELARLFVEAGHSRLPVYRDSLDAIIGMVHVKDVYAHLVQPSETGPPRVEQLLRSVLFVPPSMRILDLLARMRSSRTHMAIVVDEYGGTDGLVTIEDLVEEIVGEIEDEHDETEASLIRPLPGGSYDVDARLGVTELEAELGTDFLPEEDDNDIDTVGGLIFVLAGRVPAIGEVIEHPSGYRFEIVDGEPRRITRVRVHPPAGSEAEGEA
ncbi:hemolysin family protein [Pedomonas sp. V897]|uniref:hemolysin family protein n=1 Tax=Pedomonas sp. V897 TaxID=3446482 RepID=UPI003EE3EBC1